MGDAAFAILSKKSTECSGNYFIDEERFQLLKSNVKESSVI